MKQAVVHNLVVLIASDQEWNVLTLDRMLRDSGFLVVRAFSGREATRLTDAIEPDVVLVEARLPDISGLEVCQAIRELAGDRVRPTVLMASHDLAPSDVSEALMAGAWDVISQPFDPDVLMARLRTFAEARRAAERGRRTAMIDGVTGLYNLTGLARRATEIAASARRQKTPVGCIAVTVAPVEYPGEVMSCARDQIATTVGKRLMANVRACDIVGRIGALDFAVLTPGADDTANRNVAKRLFEQCSATRHDDVDYRLSYVADVADGADQNVEDLLVRMARSLREQTTLTA